MRGKYGLMLDTLGGRIIEPSTLGRIKSPLTLGPGTRIRVSVDRERFLKHANDRAADEWLYVVEVEGCVPIRCHEVVFYGPSKAVYAVFPPDARSRTGASLFIETYGKVKLLA